MYGSKHRVTDGSYENRKDSTTNYSSSKRECNDETTNHRKYIRTQTSSSNRSSQQRQNGDKEKKSTKEPLRVVGDWSEFRSSTGKTYFYNCKTEVSQWEKPKGWPSDTPSSSSRSKKEPTNVAENSSRHKPDDSFRSSVKESQSHSKSSSNNHPTSTPSNGNADVQQRLPSPTDDNSSRMSFSSTSSQESSAQRQTNGINETMNSNSIVHQDSSNRSVDKEKSESPMEIDGQTSTISKAERDQEIQRYYRADFIQHLTDWSSTQFEKQCLKLFDDYYGYSAKMSNALSELKAFKSNYRVLEIKRSILTQK